MNKSKTKRLKDDPKNRKVTDFFKKSAKHKLTQVTDQHEHADDANNVDRIRSAVSTEQSRSTAGGSTSTRKENSKAGSSSKTATSDKVQRALEEVFGYKEFKTDLQRKATEAVAKGNY